MQRGLCGTYFEKILCKKSNSNAKEAEPGREANIVMHFGDVSREGSAWEKN